MSPAVAAMHQASRMGFAWTLLASSLVVALPKKLLECASVKEIHRLPQDGTTSLPVMKGGFCRGHYIAGLIYGVAASPREQPSAAQKTTYDRVVKTLVPEMASPSSWQNDSRQMVSELAAEFGEGANTTDYTRG